MKRYSLPNKYILILLCNIFIIQSIMPVDWKGIGSSIQNFPLFKKDFWEGIGQGFGAPPIDYKYSFSVYNDSSWPIWVAIQEIISIMGASFPKSNGWSVHEIAPGDKYDFGAKQYYFEMFIKKSSDSFSNHMPYLQHDEVLYQQEAIQLQEKNSTKNNYFRVYNGKQFDNGLYVHVQKAEYLGYSDTAKGQQDKNVLTMSSNLNSLIIKNSTNNDYYIGFSDQVSLKTMDSSSCLMIALIEKDSYALLSIFDKISSFRPGTIGLFDSKTGQNFQVISIGAEGFDNMSYTLEIYQDAKDIKAQMCWQGLMSGHYDMPMNRVRDITPITATLWYQSVAQIDKKEGFIDLPGMVWVVSLGLKSEILAVVTSGQAVQYTLFRPKIGDKKNIYFVYVNETDIKKAQNFIQRFLSGDIGSNIVATYQKQMNDMMDKGIFMLAPQSGSKSSTQNGVDSNLLNLAVRGALQMNQGRIEDKTSGIIGYLLGSDVFLSNGRMESVPMFYMITPSIQNQLNLPTSAVQNLYEQQLVTTAPKGMPTPNISSYTTKFEMVNSLASSLTNNLAKGI